MPYTYEGWDIVTPGVTKVPINNFNKAPMIVMWQYALTNLGSTNPPDIATFADSLNTTVPTVQLAVSFVNDPRNLTRQTTAGGALADVQSMSYGGGTTTSCHVGQSLPPLAAAAAPTWTNGL